MKAPAAGVFAPASKLTTDLANPPVTGNPPDKPDPKFERPKAINSWLFSIFSRLFAANVWAIETVSTYPTMEISNAGIKSSKNAFNVISGNLISGNPFGIWPTMETALSPRPKIQTKKVDTITAIIGPVLDIKSERN